MLHAMPITEVSASPARPRSMPAATAAPTVPQIAVACWPRSKNTELFAAGSYPAMPSRQAISTPTVAASSSAGPAASTSSATANAAGITDADGCNTDGRCVSSKSRLWARVPLTKAADGVGKRCVRPIAVAAGLPPHAPTVAETIRAGSAPTAARLLPITSTTRPAMSSRNSSGRPVRVTSAARAAICCAGVLVTSRIPSA